MIRWILIALLAVIGIGTGYWGYLEHQEKNAILIQAENTYQRAFHDLSYRMDLLQDKLGSTLAMSSEDQLSNQLIEIWQLTAQAHTDVGQLPLSLLPFHQTVEFLTSIGDFTYRTATRDLEEKPLTDDEVTTLHQLYKQATTMKDELREVQHLTLKNNLRWMDVQLALANEEEPMDSTIIDGFETVDKHVSGFTSDNSFSSLSPSQSEKKTYQSLDGKVLSEQEILEKSKNVFSVNDETELTVSKSSDGADVPMYTVTYKDEEKSAYADLIENGGHILSLLIHRPLSEKNISLHDGYLEAEKFVENQQFQNMKLSNSSEYDQICVYTFVYEQDGVQIYPDSVEVKVALDSGEVIGFSGKNFLINHHEREINEPELTLDEAKTHVNPNVEIMEQKLVIMENTQKEEILTYEFIGTLDNDIYRIFINADNGKEEEIEKISGPEAVFTE